MEASLERETVRKSILSKLMTRRLDEASLNKMSEVFDPKEIRALRFPHTELPESLSDVDSDMRETIANNLNEAIDNPPANRGSSDTAAPPEEPMIDATPEPEAAMTPEDKQTFDLALSLASSVSQHITRFSAAHQGDLKARIAALIKASAGASVGGEAATAFAQKLARMRVENEVRRKVLEADFPRFKEKAIYLETREAFVAVPKAGRRYESAVKTAFDERIAREGIKANEYERAIAEIATYENSDPELVETITEALVYGKPMDADAMKAQRNKLLNAMIARRVPSNLSNGKEYASAVFAAFTHGEVDALMSDGILPSSLPDMNPQQRKNAKKTLHAQFSKIKGSTPAPSHNKAVKAARVVSREMGLKMRRKGPSSGPEM